MTHLMNKREEKVHHWKEERNQCWGKEIPRSTAGTAGKEWSGMDTFIALLADCMEGISHWGTGGWIWMGLMMLAGVALIAAVIYLLLKGARGAGTPYAPYAAPWHGETPLETAQRRYAAGEISQDEFERIREDLGG